MIRVIALSITFAITAVAPAASQLVASSDEPVDITGDRAEFEDNIATWSGNVRVVQGEAILTAARIVASITDDGDVEEITAFGRVRYSNGAEAITGDTAVYDAVARTITMRDNVLLTQGKQVMSAGSVVYWVDTGKVRFKPAEGERIRGIFYAEQDNSQS
ncbi:MAG: LptA/OstA family protein [Pseudomonadota bacterium]